MAIRKYDAIIVHTGPRDVSLNFINEKYCYADLHEAFSDQSKVTIEVKSRRNPRSLPQNNLFHAYCAIIAEETGNSLEVVKSTLKKMFAVRSWLDSEGNEIINKETGEVLTYIQDTSQMSTIEMSELTENTRVFAMEWFGIYLAMPEEQQTFKFKK